jgi:hypothetical protein
MSSEINAGKTCFLVIFAETLARVEAQVYARVGVCVCARARARLSRAAHSRGDVYTCHPPRALRRRIAHL